MKFLTALILLLATCCIIADAAFSRARKIATHHQPQTLAIQSFMHSKTMQLNEEAGGCTYMTTIKTSCSSPASTTDQISVIFGDASGKQVQGRLDDPAASGRFSQCSTDTLKLTTAAETQCLQQICLFGLIRTGNDGWIPETAMIDGPNSLPLTIIYNTTTSLPQGSVVGINNC